MLSEGGSRIVNPHDLSFVNLSLLEGVMLLTDGGHSLVEAPSQIFELGGIVKVIWQQKDCDIEAGHKSRCNHNSQACEAFLLTTITWEAHVSPLKQALEPHSSSCHNFWYPLCSCSKLSHVTLTGIGCLMLCPKIMHQIVAQKLIFKLTGCKMTQ